MVTPSDLDDAKRIVEESGNAFHAKVLRLLRSTGWAVRISPYYSDGVSGKPREVDLIAEKTFATVTDYSGRPKGAIKVRLFIECKYIRHPTVFWMHDQDEQATFDLLQRTTPLKSTNTYTLRHHYLAHEPRRVAKLFASQNARDAEQEQIFKALNQSLNATIALRYTNVFPPSDWRVVLVVNYSVIVCSGFDRVFAVDLEKDATPTKAADTFLLEVNYAYLDADRQSVAEYFLIDVVAFDSLHDFASKTIETDIGAMAFLLSD
jgi:hypothetical protein